MAEPAQATRDGHKGSWSEPAEIAFHNVVKRYPGRAGSAVENLTFEVPPGQICVLIGPSGCGKTTALKMVNRLITITEGDITIDGASVRDLETAQLRRRIGYVFQQIGLFPAHDGRAQHRHGPPPAGLVQSADPRTRQRAARARRPRSRDGSARYPGEFSGGQQQRIGVARAMAADPPIMLMDEPFGAIDPIARDRLQNDFLRLHRQVRKTIIFVTHDIDEAHQDGRPDRDHARRPPRPDGHRRRPPRRPRPMSSSPASSALTAGSSACACGA